MAAVMLSEAVVRPGVCSLPSSSASSPRPPLLASFGNSSLRSSREARLALFFHHKLPDHRIPVRSTSLTTNASASRNGVYTVGDFMTNRGNLHVVKPTTGLDEALELLVEKRITGFPVIDDDWNLVGVVSDYDLLALDSISGGGGKPEINLFPEVNSSWKTFNKIQRLLSKTNGKVVGDVMTPAPLVVRETTNLEDAARLLLETKYRRLPVVDANGKLVGMITRGNVVRAALQLKHESENVN